MSWQEFLRTQGGRIEESGEIAFADTGAAALDGVALVPLTHHGLIRFSGEETVAFLHGQLSSDLKKLPQNTIQYSSYSTPKGRMLASFLVLRDGVDLLLETPRPLLPALQKRLSMFVLRAKTRASDASEERVLLGLAGTRALTLAESVFGELPAEPMRGKPIDAGMLWRLGGDRIELVLTPELAPTIWQRLTEAGATPAGTAVWNLSDIRTGIVWVVPGNQEEFVPQMANMDLLGAISFNKGCYPGQEIVARTHYLGKLKRRAFRVRANGPIEPGQEVFSTEMQGQPSGRIALAAPADDGHWEALVVVQISSTQHPLHLGSLDGMPLELLDLPYPVRGPND
ncbi:CAF17-like 4Fe-4S cluster assembly/insertion protein YgfZ [Chitinimonas lacunae]|uniref:YgfZ/GcvT domain-containing protein n=1 Tax=Chitinimonas lacunae TaxID=1963018 RepID=A0ABV8MR64_9NEIS